MSKVRKESKRRWKTEDLLKAILECRQRSGHARLIANSYGIPFSTLRGRLKYFQENEVTQSDIKFGRFTSTFTPE